MKPKSAVQKFDFRKLLTISLTAIALTSPLLYLIAERISSALVLRAEQSRLEQAHLSRSYQEIVPPPDSSAVRNGEKLIATIDGLKEFVKSSPNTVNGFQLVRLTAPGMAAPAFLEPTPILDVPTKSTPPPSWQDLREQFRQPDAILAEARKILESPVAPRVQYDSRGKRFDLGQTHTLCAMLKTKSTLDLREGRVSDAIGQLEAIRKIAEMYERSGTIIHSVMEIGILSFAFIKPVWEILQSPFLTETDLLRLQKLLEKDDFVLSTLVAMQVELARMPQVYQEAIDSKSTATLLGMADSFPGILGHEALIKVRNELWPTIWESGDLARSLGSWRRAIVLSQELPGSRNWGSIKEKFDSLDPEISNYDRWRFPAYATTVGASYIDGLLRAAVRIQVQFELARAAVGLARFKLANSSYPASLDELSPQYLPGLPHDWYDGQPLKYRRLEDGSYLLYSIGEDGKDDGGNGAAPPGKKAQSFQGRDVVWPQAVPPKASKTEVESNLRSTSP